MTRRRLTYVPIDDLPVATRNPKAHDIESTKASIRRFGFLEPTLLDDRTGRLIAGHGRREALTEMRDAGEDVPNGVVVDKRDRWTVPLVVGWSSKDDADAEAAGVALNRIGEGLWDLPTLVAVLDDQRQHDLDIETIGFRSEDLDLMLAQLAAQPATDAAAVADDAIRPPTNPVTKRGDVWLLGEHRLLCGDCRIVDDVTRAVAGRAVAVAVTSPPYAEQREYDAGSGFVPIPPDEYVEWFAAVAANVAAVLAEDGSWFVNIKPPGHDLDTDLYVFDLVVAHVREWGWHFVTELCWERNGVPKRVRYRFKNQFEPVYHFARASFKMRPDNVRSLSENAITAFGPGAGDTGWGDHGHGGRLGGRQGQGRYADGVGQGGAPVGGDAERRRADQLASLKHAQPRKNGRRGGSPVDENEQGRGPGQMAPGEAIGPGLAYPGNRLPTFSGSHEAVGHAAAFPVGLPAWFVRAYTDEGDVVFDPFAGSGSTILAAHQEHRVGVGIELSPAYCDVICERFQRHTGVVPTLERTGKAFKARRGSRVPRPPTE